ncbi:MAG: nucleotidyltransferase [Roseiarcus sp.]|jgi:hypothetical protein
MPIPEGQLTTWSGLGSVAQSRDTYATIKNVLESKSTSYANRGFTTFLQGSYGNDTNIFGDSDVDVVIELTSSFYYDLSRLADAERAGFSGAYGKAEYTLPTFKKEVIEVVTQKFGDGVKMGAKAIHIPGSGNRRDADVLPAFKFRRYRKFVSVGSEDYVEGLCFFALDGSRIENFPKLHSENCTAKHQATNQWFKPMVRIFKNMRNRMVSEGLIEDGLAPSYYLEGLLYNVPIEKFGGSYVDTFVACISWLYSADRTKCVCANGQFFLLTEGLSVTWRADKCEKFLKAAVDFWKSWN